MNNNLNKVVTDPVELAKAEGAASSHTSRRLVAQALQTGRNDAADLSAQLTAAEKIARFKKS